MIQSKVYGSEQYVSTALPQSKVINYIVKSVTPSSSINVPLKSSMSIQGKGDNRRNSEKEIQINNEEIKKGGGKSRTKNNDSLINNKKTTDNYREEISELQKIAQTERSQVSMLGSNQIKSMKGNDLKRNCNQSMTQVRLVLYNKPFRSPYLEIGKSPMVYTIPKSKYDKKSKKSKKHKKLKPVNKSDSENKKDDKVLKTYN